MEYGGVVLFEKPMDGVGGGVLLENPMDGVRGWDTIREAHGWSKGVGYY